MSSLVQYQAMVDIRATTEAHTDIADVLLSINGADTVASLHAMQGNCSQNAQEGRFIAV